MEIYYCGEDNFMCAIYVICTVLFAACPFIAIKYLIKEINAYRESGLKFPTLLYIIFVLLALVPLIGVWGFSRLFAQTVNYNHDMKNGEALYLIGDIEVVSCEEVDYRGDFIGYNVELSVDGNTIAPTNSFPEDVVAYFNSGEELIIQYGIIEGDGIYVWSIKTVDEE